MVNRKAIPLIFLFLFLLEACGNSDATDNPAQKTVQQKAIKVETYSLESKAQSAPIISSGTLDSKATLNLSFKIGGVIRQILVEEGQSVRAGQLLATLDQSEISAQVTQAQRALEKANRDYQRAERLYKDTVTTLEQVQNAETAKDVAQAQLKIASFNQEYSAIYAPVPGKILRKMAESREVVSPGKAVLTLGSTAQAQVIRVGLSDRDIVKVKLGDRAKVQFDAYEDRYFEAELSEISESANPRTGTFEVELSLKDHEKELKNGFIGKVEIYPAAGDKTYPIPLGALVGADKKTAYIFVPDAEGKTARKISVPIQRIDKDFFLVRENDLQGIRRVISKGAPYLRQGSRIQIQNNSSQ